jgi:hypothetical protein
VKAEQVEHGALALRALQVAVETGDYTALFKDAGALYGIARPGIWAGEVEGLLRRVPHTDRLALRRAAKAIAASVVEERASGRPLREVPVLPLLVVHGKTWRVLGDGEYLVVERELVVVELGRLQAVETRTPVGETGSRPLKPTEAYEEHGVTAKRVRWTYGAGSIAWDPVTLTLDLPGATVREGRAVYSERCDQLLRLLGGEILLDWIATAPQLQRPTSAVQLRGPPGVGKGLFTAAMACWLGGRVDYQDATGDANAGLAHAPLVVLDEGVGDSRPDEFRKITGGRDLRIRMLYRMPEELIGCPRMLITSNEHDPLRLGREDLSSDSQHALGQRIIVLEANPGAAALLASWGGWQATDGWAEPEGELVRHFRWLAETRGPAVVPGNRFVVQGDSSAWVATAHLRRGVGADVLAAYRAYQDDAELRKRCESRDDPDPFLVIDGQVGISAGALQRCWRTLIGPHEKVPASQHLARALKNLSGQKQPTRSGREGDRGPRRYWVAIEQLAEEDDP